MIKKLKKEQLLIGALLGILLLVIVIPVPGEKKEQEEQEQVQVQEKTADVPAADTIESQLKEILQKISGVGRVEVFITYRDNGKIVIEKDQLVSEELVQEADSSGGTRTTTTNRTEDQTVYTEENIPYIIQELSPSVEGILIVAEGGGNASVKTQIRETIEALFGLDAHKISIMKMEVSR